MNFYVHPKCKMIIFIEIRRSTNGQLTEWVFMEGIKIKFWVIKKVSKLNLGA